MALNARPPAKARTGARTTGAAMPDGKAKLASRAKAAAVAPVAPVPAVPKPDAGKGPLVPPPGRARQKRAIGRPAANGNSVGREKLLKTACDLLKTVPPNKLTRFMVAQKASVDPSLIRYYFRDRISLLAAAAERLSDQYVERLAAGQRAADSTAIARLQARLDMNVNIDVTYAHFRRLLLDELMVSDAPQARAVASKITLRGAQAYTDIVQSGVADGSLREDDPVMLFIAVVALSSYFPSAKTVYEIATGQKIGAQAMAEKYRDFVSGLVARGMAPSTEGRIALPSLPAIGQDDAQVAPQAKKTRKKKDLET